jgi:hypothetical protein
VSVPLHSDRTNSRIVAPSDDARHTVWPPRVGLRNRQHNPSQLISTVAAGIGTNVPDMREREGDDLARVGRIGEDLMVSDHRSVEAHFPRAWPKSPRPLPPESLVAGEAVAADVRPHERGSLDEDPRVGDRVDVIAGVRWQRSPAEKAVALAPGDPGRPPDVVGNPDPAVGLIGDPPSVVVNAAKAIGA